MLSQSTISCNDAFSMIIQISFSIKTELTVYKVKKEKGNLSEV
jgi:hypothetical protein